MNPPNNKAIIKVIPSEIDPMIEKQAKQMVSEIMRFLDAREKDHPGSYSALSRTFLAGLIGGLMSKLLYAVAADKSKVEKQRASDTIKAFTVFKNDVQEAVSAGFTGAMQAFSGRTIEYYCLIKPIPEAVNKKEC